MFGDGVGAAAGKHAGHRQRRAQQRHSNVAGGTTCTCTAASDVRSNGGARQLARHRCTRERLPEKSNLIWVC